MIDLLRTVPPVLSQSSRETIPYSYDTTPLLGPGESPTLPVVELVNAKTGVAYPEGLIGVATPDGVYINQIVGNLIAGEAYNLFFTFTAASGKTLSEYLRIECKI